ALHEARDRDYFFTWAFVCWGAWAGFGAVQVARAAVARMGLTGRSARIVLAIGVIFAALPAALNWSVVRHERRDEQQRAERESMAILDALPPRAVFIANGDNDTYPLWYLQQVRAMRRDVTVVTAPLLTPAWNRAELRRRYGLLDSVYVANWYGARQTLANIRAHAAREGRPVVASSFKQGRDSAF
ncbi:MAG TPA: hypothetical protein VIG47_17930, partial [Gemmatimonadaceae bacterium]